MIRCAYVLTLVALLSLTGCGRSFVDPHVHSSKLMDFSYTRNPSDTSGTKLQAAIEAAQDQRSLYMNAVAEHGSLHEVGSLGTGALLMGLVAANAVHPVARHTGITMAGAAGALYFGQQHYTLDRPGLYAAGADAISCTLASQAPLMARLTVEVEVQKAADALAPELSKLQTARGAQTRSAGKWDKSSLDQLEAAARQAVLSAQVIRASFDGAAIQLREHVLSIVTAVDREVMKSLPNPNAALQQAGNFAGFLSQVVPPVPATPRAAGLASTGTTPVDILADAVSQKLAELRSKVELLSTMPTGAPDMSRCVLANLPNLLRVEPNEAMHSFARTRSGTFPTWTCMVLGGGVQRIVVISNGTISGASFQLERQDLAPGVTQLRITPREATSSGDAWLVIADEKGQTISVRLVVEPATRPVTGSANGGRDEARTASNGSRPPADADFTAGELGALRAYLRLSPFDSTTLTAADQAAIKAALIQNGIAAGDKLDRPTLNVALERFFAEIVAHETLKTPTAAELEYFKDDLGYRRIQRLFCLLGIDRRDQVAIPELKEDEDPAQIKAKALDFFNTPTIRRAIFNFQVRLRDNPLPIGPTAQIDPETKARLGNLRSCRRGS